MDPSAFILKRYVYLNCENGTDVVNIKTKGTAIQASMMDLTVTQKIYLKQM